MKQWDTHVADRLTLGSLETVGDDSGITVTVVQGDYSPGGVDAGSDLNLATALASGDTDSTGAYTITGLNESTTYTVLVSSQNSSEQLLVSTFTTDTAAIQPLVIVGNLLLTGTGTISGQLTLFGTGMAGAVFIPGTSHTAFSNSDGTYTILGVPVRSGIEVNAVEFSSGLQGTPVLVNVTVGADTANTDIALSGTAFFGEVLASDFSATAQKPFPFRNSRSRIITSEQLDMFLETDNLREGISNDVDGTAFGSSWGIRATVNVTEYWSELRDDVPAAEVGGVFFKGDPNNESIYAVLRLIANDTGDGLKARAVLFYCENFDSNCEDPREISSFDFLPVLVKGTPYTLSVECNLNNGSGTFGECTFGDGNTTTTLDVTDAGPPFDDNTKFNPSEDDNRFVGLRPVSTSGNGVGGDDGGGGNGLRPALHIRALFDDVDKGSVAYPAMFTTFDDFTAETEINPVNWRDVDSVDVVTGGELIFDKRILHDPACNQNCDEEGMDGNLLEMMSHIPTHFQADVMAAANATTASNTGCIAAGGNCTLHIGVAGTLYNDGNGLSGDVGNVNALLTLQRDPVSPTWNIKYYIWHCSQSNCQTPDLTREGTLVTGASVDTYYRLVMDWDTTANTLTFVVDTGAPVIVDLATETFPPISRLPQDPFAGFLGLTFGTASDSSEDYRISGRIDNLLFY